MAQYIQYSANRPPAEIDPQEQFQQCLEVIGHLLDNPNDPAAEELSIPVDRRVSGDLHSGLLIAV